MHARAISWSEAFHLHARLAQVMHEVIGKGLCKHFQAIDCEVPAVCPQRIGHLYTIRQSHNHIYQTHTHLRQT